MSDINGSKPTNFPLDESKLDFKIPRTDAPRENVLKLGSMITNRIGLKATADDPEYWGLAGVMTDEMVDVALKMGVRKPKTTEQLMKLTKMEREPLEKRDMPKAVSEPKTAPERKINFVSGKADAHGKTAYFVYADSITEAAKAYFERIYVPLMQYVKLKSPAENIGVAFPPVVFSHECAEVIAAAEKAAQMGCRYALITNLWQTSTAKRLGLKPAETCASAYATVRAPRRRRISGWSAL